MIELNQSFFDNEEAEIKKLKEENKNQFDTGYRYGVKESIGEIEKLREENKKLRECVEFYSSAFQIKTSALINEAVLDSGKKARQTLKELEGEK